VPGSLIDPQRQPLAAGEGDDPVLAVGLDGFGKADRPQRQFLAVGHERERV